MEQPMRDDGEVQEAGRNILEGVAPERKQELAQLWTRYAPKFSVVENAGDAGLFVMMGGCYRDVWFNPRAMRAFWLTSFIAWEGYRAVAESVNDDNIDLARFRRMIDCLLQILTENDPEAIPLPGGVPAPGSYPDDAAFPQERATAELATFATGWAFLHELRHIQHQQDGTGAGAEATREEYYSEEFSCDEYATRFLLDQIDTFAASEKAASGLVRQKRELGIYFALFAMALIEPQKASESDTHPAMQDRINRVVQQMATSGLEKSDVVAHGAFSALWMIRPEVAAPFKRFVR
jgi:Peptidase U49